MTTNPLPDPLNENDHRNRVDLAGDILIRRECGYWHWIWTGAGKQCPLVSHRHVANSNEYTLAGWVEIAGPLRFADEVTA